jgi:hypothetical protein
MITDPPAWRYPVRRSVAAASSRKATLTREVEAKQALLGCSRSEEPSARS